MMTWESIANRLLVAGVLVLSAGCSERSQDQSGQNNPPFIIEPNVSVGKIHAGITAQQVIAELGQPQVRTANALEYTRLGLAILPDTNSIVQSVMCGDVTGINGPLVNRFAGRTRDGIGMRSTREEVVKALGEPSSSQRFPGGVESMAYPAFGLTLTLEGGKVHHLIVRFSGPAQPDRTVNLAPAAK